MRLLRRFEFTRVVKGGHRVVGRYICIDSRPAKRSRLGISASTRYGSAPKRNRIKRLIREAFRLSFPTLPPVEINVIPRQSAKKAKLCHIVEELRRLLNYAAK